MPTVGELCNREVIVTRKEDSIRDAATLMRDCHVGDVVVVEDSAEGRIPVGVLTDRDIVVGVLAAAGSYMDQLTVGDVLVREPVTAREEEDILDVIKRMRAAAVRRIPVVGKGGALVGIVSMDDMLALTCEMLTSLSELVPRQRHHEEQARG